MSVHAIFQQIDWTRLFELASHLNGQLPCKPLTKMANGLHNLARLLEFSDGTLWVTRISISRMIREQLRKEAIVIGLICDRTDVPIPMVFDYKLEKNDTIGHKFMPIITFPSINLFHF